MKWRRWWTNAARFGRQHPGEQGAAIRELMALWLLGHDDDMRKGLLRNQIAQVRELIEGRE